MQIDHIRNFSIIAHIDHGKSTLSDRFIQVCGGLSDREMAEQVLDSMDLERERGITIKAQSVTLNYKADNGEVYQLNFIDTPGHVDFSYEVSRSLSACEGALLVVDASQGVEAQTVSNCYTAVAEGLTVLPVLNKIDLPSARPEEIKHQIEGIIGIEAQDAICISAKTGKGIKELLECLIDSIPAPTGEENAPLQALIIDSWFDSYLGVVALVRIKQGKLTKGDKVLIKSTGEGYVVESLGVFTPKRESKGKLLLGEVGFVVCGVKDIFSVPVGDTITGYKNPVVESLSGFKKVQPKVYAGMFPVNGDDYASFRDALAKLSINDAALFYEPENSQALGSGFRIGFLGMLHMEIVQQRLEREYNLYLIATAPTVVYKLITSKQEEIKVDSPAKLLSSDKYISIQEPIVEANMLLPKKYLGAVMKLCIERRGEQKNLQYINEQASLSYYLPMSEVVLDFFDKLKSISKGYASLDYELRCYQDSQLVKLDILLNGEKVDALALLIHKSQAYFKGRMLTEKMKEFIPRQMFDISIQAAIGNHIIARQTVKALRKNVTAKCYGGDITRKKKLLEKQKAGKKRMKNIGKVQVPQEAFLAMLNIGSN